MTDGARDVLTEGLSAGVDSVRAESTAAGATKQHRAHTAEPNLTKRRAANDFQSHRVAITKSGAHAETQAGAITRLGKEITQLCGVVNDVKNFLSHMQAGEQNDSDDDDFDDGAEMGGSVVNMQEAKIAFKENV
eukprot:jgi/Undpi1/7845/HiC_scaffold_23.g10317.m1